ncbi:hypothetical protein [Frigoriglobus tundricola]|uniref:Uncharacterized protein n=1 Tax=Frigoriglobus tundricola TaxID=2774151 RepID=A0A6M5Z3R9_9BACT|nr:hypothetical protein [Frigoriglobus tundricola]QJX01048.1 hypothetical protein FTUN_8686 [Frigoriglobus tundricola]
MEHIPAIHAAKVGMRYPAVVRQVNDWGLVLDLDLTNLAPGRSPRLRALLMFERTPAPEVARSRESFSRIDVVLIEADRESGPVTASLPADPAWLAWNSGTVRDLARRIRETGETVLLPVLADALEEAGCRDAALLEHCRRPLEGPSWVVDLLATQEL